MATKRSEKIQEKYKFPSYFGSHSSMIDVKKTEELKNLELVACKDEHGVYITQKNRLDSGLADPNRYTTERLEYLCPKDKDDNS